MYKFLVKELDWWVQRCCSLVVHYILASYMFKKFYYKLIMGLMSMYV
jgi:hypothetical protein